MILKKTQEGKHKEYQKPKSFFLLSLINLPVFPSSISPFSLLSGHVPSKPFVMRHFPLFRENFYANILTISAQYGLMFYVSLFSNSKPAKVTFGLVKVNLSSGKERNR